MEPRKVKINWKKRKTWRVEDYDREMRELNAPDRWVPVDYALGDAVPVVLCK
jgi:hypothetical protein